MALQNATQFGQTFVWGFGAADAPNIASGFFPTGAELKYEPEVYDTSMNGEGHVDSVVVSKRANRKASATFTGRITSDFDPTAVGESFQWLSRKWIVKPITKPLTKGAFAEISIEAESFALVT